MKKIFKILGEVKSEFPSEIIMESGNLMGKENLLNENLESNIPSSSQYLVIERNNLDITPGLKFDVIFPFSNPSNYINTEAILKFVNVKPNISTEIIPAGYSGIGLIDFPYGKPKILEDLGVFMKQSEDNKEYALYLTTQPVMDRILELLNE